MAAGILAAVVVAVLGVLWLAELGPLREARLQRDAAEIRADRAEQAVNAIRTDSDLACSRAGEEIDDLRARCERLTAELATTKRLGELAARAGMAIVAAERAQHAASVVSLAKSLAARPALPAGRRAPEPPVLLPSGDWLVEREGLILPPDDELARAHAGGER